MQDDIILSWIIPRFPRDWLRVNKKTNIIANKLLLKDPRIHRDKINNLYGKLSDLPLETYVKYNNVVMVKNLLNDYRTDLNGYQSYVARTCAVVKNVKMLELFLQHCKQRNYLPKVNLLYYGIQDIEIFKYLLNNEYYTPRFHHLKDCFVEVVHRGNAEIIELLKNIDISKLNLESNKFVDNVKQCCKSNRVDIMRAICLNPSFNPSFDDNVALKIAFQNGCDEIVEKLINHPNFKLSPDDEYAKLIVKESKSEIMKMIAIILKNKIDY